MNNNSKFYLLAIAVVLVGGAVAFKAIDAAGKPVEKAMDWVEKAGSAIAQLFGGQPKINIESHSVSLPTEEIAELALIQRKVLCFTKYESTWAGSKAVAIIKGEFTVKVGYDLKKASTITFDEASRTVTMKLPEPELLSCETVSQTLFYDEGGVLKKLDAKEVTHAHTQNREAARQEFDKMGVSEEAKARMAERVKDIFRGLASTVIVNDRKIDIPVLP